MPRLDYENMSDEEFANAPPPPPLVGSREDQIDDDPDDGDDDDKPESGDAVDLTGGAKPDESTPDSDDESDAVDDGDDSDPDGDDSDQSGFLAAGDDDDLEALAKAGQKQPEAPADAGEKPADGAKPEGDEPPKSEATPEVLTPEQAAQYKAFHDRLMAPIKVNGKEFKLQNVDEAISLIQMGGNYTKKLQELKPHLRLVKMLETNQVDEAKLAFLIDLDKKDPEALKKYLKDKQIDVMDVDTTVEPNYVQKTHAPSEAAMNFDETLKDVASIDEGKKLIVKINTSWDKASKDAIVREPQLLRTLTTHKQNGLYDLIAAEVERQKVLGNFQGVPYINAYYQTGLALQQKGVIPGPQTQPSGQAEPQPQPAAQPQPQPQQRPVIETRTAKPKPKVDNSAKAKAASSTRSNPAKEAKANFNPLGMSDEEFEKLDRFGNRL